MWLPSAVRKRLKEHKLYLKNTQKKYLKPSVRIVCIKLPRWWLGHCSGVVPNCSEVVTLCIFRSTNPFFLLYVELGETGMVQKMKMSFRVGVQGFWGTVMILMLFCLLFW